MAARGYHVILVVALFSPTAWDSQAKANESLLELLQNKRCPQCQLADVDLVHADLRDADLSKAGLQRANLSRARLDGADLSGANLSFTSLQGASLRGASLKGAKLYSTDLRDADLTGAILDSNALEEAHWSGAKGMQPQAQSHAALHNAGVDAAHAGRWHEAEKLFSAAIMRDPKHPLSWVARGISRSEQAKDEFAANDFRYAGKIFAEKGQRQTEQQLNNAATAVANRRFRSNKRQNNNGWGGQILSGMAAAAQALAPLATKALIPLGIGF